MMDGLRQCFDKSQNIFDQIWFGFAGFVKIGGYLADNRAAYDNGIGNFGKCACLLRRRYTKTDTDRQIAVQADFGDRFLHLFGNRLFAAGDARDRERGHRRQDR